MAELEIELLDFERERPRDHGMPGLVVRKRQRRMQPDIDIVVDREGRDGDGDLPATKSQLLIRSPRRREARSIAAQLGRAPWRS
jgi:hypothetical protein